MCFFWRIEMKEMFRLNIKERELIREKCIEINKKLINQSKEPMRDSELTHKILELALKNAFVNKNGELEI